MAGHSKWANIRHRKGAQDAARAKVFAKYSKEIMVAAANGGGDPNTNSSLRLAISKARAKSMPKANIKKAILKATGVGSDASSFKESSFGGNVGGISFLVNCLSDNQNRVTSAIQSYFRKYGGQISGTSAVSYIFDRKGVIEIASEGLDEDVVMMCALEEGALDFEHTNGSFFIYTTPAQLAKVKEGLEKKLDIHNFKTLEVTFEANNLIKLEKSKAEKILKFVDILEEDDDIQEVFHNLDPESLL